MIKLANEAIDALYQAALAGDADRAKAIYDKYRQNYAVAQFEKAMDTYDFDRVIALIEEGSIHVDAKTKINGETALMKAAAVIDEQAVINILALGADVNIQDVDGNPVLIRMALLENDAQLVLRMTPGSQKLVSSEKFAAIMAPILRRSPDIYLANSNGITVFEAFRANKDNEFFDIFFQYVENKVLLEGIVADVEHEGVYF